jgi:hypothetical protein
MKQQINSNPECLQTRPVLRKPDVEEIYSSGRIEDILKYNILYWAHRVMSFKINLLINIDIVFEIIIKKIESEELLVKTY